MTAAPEKVFAATSDPEILPHYVPQLTDVEVGEDDGITIEARHDGHTQRAEAWFRAGAREHEIEWGANGSEYRGSIRVASEGEGIP